MEGVERIMYLLQKGNEYIDTYYNVQKACEYFAQARRCIESIYGNQSGLSSFVNMFDFIWEEYHGDYRAAALKLADAGEFLESFGEQNVADEFTSLIFEKKEELLHGVAADTMNILSRMDVDFSVNDILWKLMLAGNDVEEMLNRAFIDRLGLPRRFHYLIQNICKNKPDISQDMLHELLSMIDFMEKIENKNVDTLSQEERINNANKIYEFVQKNVSLWSGSLGAGMAAFLKNEKKQMDYDMFRGMVKMGEQERADELLSRMEQKDFEDIYSRIEFEQTKCCLEYQKGNQSEAEKILDEMIQMENDVII